MSMRASRFIGLILAACLGNAAYAETRATLTDAERTNGAQTLVALSSEAATALESSLQVESLLGRAVCAATVVGEDGYVLTKASEVPDTDAVRLKLSSGQTAPLREVRREVRHDLLLLHASGVRGLHVAEFTASRATQLGQWLCSRSFQPKDRAGPRIGTLSAARRRVPGNGAAIGIRMDERPPAGAAKGVHIIGIAADSPAAEAGLEEGDIITEIGGETALDYRQVHEVIRQRQPGDVLELRYRREGKTATARVRLASRTKVLRNWEGEDFANAGVSRRTDNFVEVLQHTLPLYPADMGGPLCTLDGRIIGINIARVDRVTTFALPMEVFSKDLATWIEADRHPPKALKATE
jgi:serine protease Do